MKSSNGNTFRVAGHLCGEFPAQRPLMRSFDVFFDLRLNKRLSKQSWGWWFETISRPLWRHRNAALNPQATNGVSIISIKWEQNGHIILGHGYSLLKAISPNSSVMWSISWSILAISETWKKSACAHAWLGSLIVHPCMTGSMEWRVWLTRGKGIFKWSCMKTSCYRKYFLITGPLWRETHRSSSTLTKDDLLSIRRSGQILMYFESKLKCLH